MDVALCKLTLVYPPALEDFIGELLLTADPPLYGFTTWTADGHGLDFANASSNERVRGRIRRGVMMLVLSRQRLPELVARIKDHVTVPGLAYWIEPVEQFERLTHASAPPAAAPQVAEPQPDDATPDDATPAVAQASG